MLHTKPQGHWPFGSGEEDFWRVFTIYEGVDRGVPNPRFPPPLPPLPSPLPPFPSPSSPTSLPLEYYSRPHRKQQQQQQVSHIMQKRVFGDFRPDKIQTSLLSYRN